MSVDHHTDGNDITFSLIELSEMGTYLFESNRANKSEWSDAMFGWKSGLNSLKLSNSITSVKKKKVLERVVSSLHNGGLCSNHVGDYYWSNTSSEPKVNVRCVSDDFKEFPIPPWKSNIEQGTYRYIQDNGSYRTLKFMFDNRRDWYTIRKNYPEKVSAAWHYTCKRMQQEVRRQQWKDLTNADKERGTNQDLNSSARSSVEPDCCDDTYASKSDTNIEAKCDLEKISPTVTKKYVQRNIKATNEPETFMLDTVIRPLYKNEIRVESTHSGPTICPAKKMKTIHESEPVTPVLQQLMSTGSQMCKSATDLFIKNFSSRICALEDEIKKDSKWLRRNEIDLTKAQNARTKFKEMQCSIFIENCSSHLSPRVSKTEALTSSIFSVKPITQKDLKTLEKTRSYNKSAATGSQNSDIINHDTSRSLSSNSTKITHNDRTNPGSDSEQTNNNYKSSVNNSNQLFLSTLTGTKINTLINKRASKGLSTPSTITICDNSSTAAANILAEHHSGTFKQVHVVDKKNEKKVYLQNVPPALLPEISGKRLEMTNISHRLF